jgi:acetylglutamate kinase
MMDLLVIKIGGNIVDDKYKLRVFLKNLSKLKCKWVLVHGGGKIATKIAKDMGVESQMIEGRRITSEAMRDVVSMVYGGLINKQLVSDLQSLGKNAIGLSGADGSLINAEKRPVKNIDYGYVGDVESINKEFLKGIIEMGLCPVIAPLSYNPKWGILNTNADTVASEIAKAMAKYFNVSLVYGFEKAGVLRDLNEPNSIIAEINIGNYEELKTQNVIFDGMIPKIDNAFSAVKEGLKAVYICDALQIDLMEQEGARLGTKISL